MYMVIMFLAVVVVMLVMLAFYVVSYKKLNDMETVSGYECGFDICCSTRMNFSYRFFLISVLFLIFDVEIVLMLVIPFLSLSKNFITVIILFLVILIFGLLYEYYYGSLNWL